MNRKPRAFTLMLILLVAVGCRPAADVSSDQSAQSNSQAIELSVKLRLIRNADSPPVAFSEGSIKIPSNFRDQNAFDGTWELMLASVRGEGQEVDGVLAPLLAGKGKLRAVCDAKRCLIYLNPNVIDNNIELALPPQLIGNGRWVWLTDAGESASGTVAVSDDDG